MIKLQYRKVLPLCLLCFCLTACTEKNPLMEPSGNPAFVPDSPNMEFSAYIQKSRDNIQGLLESYQFNGKDNPYLGGYTSQQAAEMRSPFQLPADDAICWDSQRGGGKGFLLIHGLTDSPYLMRSIATSLAQAYPCALTRAILLPGHGTIPGDALEMKHEDWQAITDYGVQSFQHMDQIKELYLVGFSTGTALSIRHMQAGKNIEKIKGLVMISAAVKAKSSFAWAAGLSSLFKKWLKQYPEQDGARYESFATHAGAEFYTLTKGITDYQLQVPVLMAVSGDDATIDANAARSYFCDQVSADRRALIWYNSRDPEQNTPAPCKDIHTVKLDKLDWDYQGKRYHIANYAHIALSMSPDDPHYGVAGNYPHCKQYKAGSTAFTKCVEGKGYILIGETDIGKKKQKKKLGYDYWRRGTFNPDYERLEKSIICFVSNTCSLDDVLTLSKE